MKNKNILFLEYWAELSEKIEKFSQPSLKHELFSLLWEEPLFELAACFFIIGFIVIKTLSTFGMIKFIEYLPKIMCLIL